MKSVIFLILFFFLMNPNSLTAQQIKSADSRVSTPKNLQNKSDLPNKQTRTKILSNEKQSDNGKALTDKEFLESLFVKEGNGKILNPKYFKEFKSQSQLKEMKLKFTDNKGIVYQYIGDQERLIKLFKEKNPAVDYLACKGGTICDTTICDGTKLNCHCLDNGSSTFCMCPLCITPSTLPTDTIN